MRHTCKTQSKIQTNSKQYCSFELGHRKCFFAVNLTIFVETTKHELTFCMGKSDINRHRWHNLTFGDGVKQQTSTVPWWCVLWLPWPLNHPVKQHQSHLVNGYLVRRGKNLIINNNWQMGMNNIRDYIDLAYPLPGCSFQSFKAVFSGPSFGATFCRSWYLWPGKKQLLSKHKSCKWEHNFQHKTIL